jgi:hypothetical protein
MQLLADLFRQHDESIDQQRTMTSESNEHVSKIVFNEIPVQTKYMGSFCTSESIKQSKLNKKQLSVIKEQVVSGTDHNTMTVTQPEDEEGQPCWESLKHGSYRPQQTE